MVETACCGHVPYDVAAAPRPKLWLDGQVLFCQAVRCAQRVSQVIMEGKLPSQWIVALHE